MPRDGTASLVGWLRRLPALLAVVLLTTTAGMAPSFAQSAPKAGAYRSDALQAVFLINFIRFTEWPEAASPGKTPFVIGVAGSRAIEDELLTLAETQRVRERRIHVISIKTANDLAGCHLVYINPAPGLGDESAPRAAELLPHLRGKPVLTVSESPSFLAEGGIVNFFMGEGGKLRFEIALETARSADLKLSSKLLDLARIVTPPKP
ncbi:MAG: YfiR family protein [Burkholderiales bacterium]|nr:YfiR family protein [Opitutaceae bacterium]